MHDATIKKRNLGFLNASGIESVKLFIVQGRNTKFHDKRGPVTTAWRVLRLRMEETASGHGEYRRIY
jgi:hypothetical protein